MPGEKFHDRAGEDVVAITCDHMPRTTDIDEVDLREARKKLVGSLLGRLETVRARASLFVISIGLALLLGQVLIVLAYRYASAVKVGPFIYAVIVFTALIDWVSGIGCPPRYEAMATRSSSTSRCMRTTATG
jgi:hypothetical protein